MPAPAASSYRHPNNYCNTNLFPEFLCLLHHRAATPFSQHTSFSAQQLSLDILCYILSLIDITITINLHVYSYVFLSSRTLLTPSVHHLTYDNPHVRFEHIIQTHTRNYNQPTFSLFVDHNNLIYNYYISVYNYLISYYFT